MPETGTYYSFRGMKAADESGTVDPPELGDIQEFVVTAECVGEGIELRADGERRPVLKMKVTDVQLGKVSPAPKTDQLPFEDEPPLPSDD